MTRFWSMTMGCCHPNAARLSATASTANRPFARAKVPRRVITVRRIDAKYIHSFMEAE